MSGTGTFTLGTFGGAGAVTFGTATQSDGTLVVNDSLTIQNSGGFLVKDNATLQVNSSGAVYISNSNALLDYNSSSTASSIDGTFYGPGSIEVDQSTLALGLDANISTSDGLVNVNIAAGATLDLAGSSETIGSLNGD